MRRSFDENCLNFYLNHSIIYPDIAPDDGPEYLDSREILDDKRNYFFTVSSGSLLFLYVNDNVYKIDAYFLRNRGAKAKAAIKEGIDYMFSQGAERIIAEVPDFNKPSKILAGNFGFRRVEVRDHAWLKDGVKHDVIVYELKKEDYGKYS